MWGSSLCDKPSPGTLRTWAWGWPHAVRVPPARHSEPTAARQKGNQQSGGLEGRVTWV